MKPSTPPDDPQRDVLHRGKDLSIALPRAEVERVRNKFILDQESSVRSSTSAGSSSASQQPHRAVRPTMPPAPARPSLARRGIRLWVAALLLAVMAAGAVLYSTKISRPNEETSSGRQYISCRSSV